MKFDASTHKMVIIINEELPLGLAMNALTVIGVSLGKTFEGIVGADLTSRDNVCYPGVVKAPLPILKADEPSLKLLQSNLSDNQEIELMPFSSLAQSCRTYEEYQTKLSGASDQDLKLAAIGIVGLRKQVNKYTGNLSLYK